ncbi:hypothetical protein acdb102_15940 [Acidothermaceae bacterium B102]|nr:hypothetical protein acdb102_15940 [Acidothermaceae bacterium B102]
MQLCLRPEDFQPLPGGLAHYVPVLQNNRGELDALRHQAPNAWGRLTPIVCMVGGKEVGVPVTDSSVRSRTKLVAEALSGHLAYIDFVRQDPAAVVLCPNGPSTLIRRTHERLRLRGSQFIPVYRERWHSAVAASAVRDASDEDGRGLALRLEIDSHLAAAGSPADRAATALQLLDTAPEDTDLVIDLGHLQHHADPDLEGIATVVRDLSAELTLRNLVIVATTMPASLGGGVVPQGTLGSLPRHERAIYRAVRRLVPDSLVVYGDYAVQHPEPPVTKGGPGMRPNIRYTTRAETLVARGSVSVQEGGNDEYPRLCSELVAHTAFAGPGFSWGDDTISGCNDGLVAPGAQRMWRGAGTSHHLQHVLNELVPEPG